MNDDRVLIERIVQGDRDAFAEVVRKYQGPVIRLCYSLLHNHQEAEDLAQEVFVKAFYALERFKGSSAFYTWLYRIASNHCLDYLRKKSRHPEQSWDELLEKRGSEIEKLLSKDPAAGQSREDQELVHQVLEHVSADFRIILVLRDIQGLTYEEIAQALSCSLDAVKGRLKRARQDFRDKLRHFLALRNV